MMSQTFKYLSAITLVISLFTWFTFSGLDALALLAGTVWGGLNLYLIGSIIEGIVLTKRYWQAALMMVVKFPLLYGLGYFLLSIREWNLWFLLAGPPLAFAVVALTLFWKHYVVRSA